MEAQMHRDPHDIEVKREEHDQHHGEKKSVLKKVKDKAKKIKDTITKHGHEHEHEHDPGRTAEDYAEEEDEEIANDPEIHGAPVYESTVIRSTNLPMQTDLNLENPTDGREDRYDGSKMASPAMMEDCEPERKAPLQPGPDAMGIEEPVFKIGPVQGLQEASKHETDHSNYQTKVTDPTREGGKEADVAPLVRRFDNLNVQDESDSKTGKKQESYTGSHDQFAPVPAVNEDQPGNESIDSGLKSADPARHETIPRDTIAGKTSSATAVLADTVVSAKNIVASKLGYGGGEHHPEGQDSAASGKPISESAAEYGRKVVQILAPVYGKVVETGSTLVSKVGGGGGSQHAGGETAADKGVTVKEYLAKKLMPGDEDKALSEAITEAFQKKKEPPLGRVTESPEVAARLGTGKEGKREGVDALSAGMESSGGGVAERLRDAVGSWLGKSTGMETAQQSLGQSHVSGVESEDAGGVGLGEKESGGQERRRLQESGN